MNQVLSLVRTARDPAATQVSLRSNLMLGEFLSLHEDTLAQLRREQVGATDLLTFLGSMIDQHERAIRTIRAQLGTAPVNGAQGAPPVVPLHPGP
jgi:hypothetical protein